MKRLYVVAIATVVALLGVPTPASAQELDFGGFLEWIHRLSGPQFIGPGLSVATTGDGPRFRFSAAYRWSFASDDAIDPDGGLTQLSVRPALEIPLCDCLDLVGGVGLHRYAGDADAFWHWSVPVHLQGRIPLSPGTRLRVGAGAHYFPEFGADDFAPLTVTAPRDGGEFVLTAYVGVDWRMF
ncbi:MAG: hypothetical protein KJP18_17925 [Gemmatimonadetes bacterium]|nr:hypothetical protein [Gemmatimonadota bacterium]NNK62638.1 hypothetical protein [Gemmatimonadota bacterium]